MSTSPSDMEHLTRQFTDFLRRKKFRITQERYKVLDRIAELDRHFNADELYVYMNTKGDGVSRATIYSTLDLLTKSNILVRHRFQGESAHFELASRMPNHDHLMCMECGRIVEFREAATDGIRDSVCKELGFKPISHSLQIFAVCQDPSTCEFNRGE
jgi:Fur family transcriptional regulator, ferric uptake regulator